MFYITPIIYRNNNYLFDIDILKKIIMLQREKTGETENIVSSVMCKYMIDASFSMTKAFYNRVTTFPD